MKSWECWALEKSLYYTATRMRTMHAFVLGGGARLSCDLQ